MTAELAFDGSGQGDVGTVGGAAPTGYGVLPIGAGDPAVDVAGAARFTTVEWVRPPRPRYRWIEATVTIALMTWLTATAAAMVGELWEQWVVQAPTATVAAGPSVPHVVSL